MNRWTLLPLRVVAGAFRLGLSLVGRIPGARYCRFLSLDSRGGSLVLGRVALASGDVATARAELLLAGQTPGSPQLISFGPNMRLARDLLRAGEAEAVLEYFELCRRFWQMGAQQLAAWTTDVQQNREPRFGANLNY